MKLPRPRSLGDFKDIDAGRELMMLLLVCAVLMPAHSALAAPDAAVADINRVLDGWHRAAAEANEERYFDYFTPEAVFLGTDATERWTREPFRKFAHPYFAKGKAWTFKAIRRDVNLAPDGKVAWFDEDLETQNLGPCRGSGVLVLQGNDWKIAQYNLSVPIPNEIFKQVQKMILEALQKEKSSKKAK